MIVILGAFGRVGRVVTRLICSREGGNVRLVTRKSRAAAEPGTQVAVARLSDAAELGRAFTGARALFALLPDDLRAEAFHAERRAMADAVVRAVRRERVPRVVLLSSSAAALGEAAGGLGADLAYFEQALGETDAALSVVRACYFQENVLEALPLAKRDGVYPNFLPPGCSIATVAVADVGAVAAAELFTLPKSGREVIDLIGPSHTPEQMAALLGAALGRTLVVSHVPEAAQPPLFQQWMSAEAARAMAETFARLGSGRVPLTGTRSEHATTRLDRTLRAALDQLTNSTSEVA